MSKHKWIDLVVVADKLSPEAKAGAIELFPFISGDGRIEPSEVDTSELEASGYVRDGAIALP